MSKLSKELRMGIHNRFDIEVVDVKTGEIKQKAQAFNVVCNRYFTEILNHTWAQEIQIGSGNGTPAASDTALFTYVGYARSDATYSPYDTFENSREHEGVWTRRIKRTIPNTEYIGSSITEVGLAVSASGSNIVTHAMLQDMNGNPISITHTSTDVINIYCTIYIHYDGQDGDFHLYMMNFSAHMGSWNSRRGYGLVGEVALMGISSRYWQMGYCYFAQSDGTDDCPSTSTKSQSTDVAQKKCSLVMNQVPISTANMGGFNALLIGWVNETGGGLTTNDVGLIGGIIETGKTLIPPTQITGESVGVGDGSTTKFKTKFMCPYSASVYVNGVLQSSGVTVRKMPVMALTTSGISNIGNGSVYYRRVNPNKLTLVMPFETYGYTVNRMAANEIIESLFPDNGIHRIQAANGSVKGSNDGVTWVDVETTTGSSQMPQAGAHYRYYKSSVAAYFYPNAFDGYNIIFDNPPAQGDVITIDYTTDYIPKDSDHVLDVELTFTFGEYNE